MFPFRYHLPSRNCKKIRSSYRAYKSNLAEDFQKKCWYCNIHDLYYGWVDEFHVDHFRPKKNEKFPEFKLLENEYTNLVYSCPSCNRFKWNRWSSVSPNWIDPTEENYGDLFIRGADFRLKPAENNEDAKFIYKTLRLFSKRKQYQYLVEELGLNIDALFELNNKKQDPDLLIHIAKLTEFQRLFFNKAKIS